MILWLDFIFLATVSLIAVSDADSEVIYTLFNNRLSCILPPAPAHGSYTSSPAGAPGDRLDSVQLNVTCKLGYKLTGEGSISCSRGQWTNPMPTCRQFCLYNGRALAFFSHCVFATGEVFVKNGGKYDPNAPDGATSQADYKLDNCVVPPPPTYGSYVSTPSASPGDSLPSFELTVSCKPDRELVGYSNISCVSGRMSHPMPLCLAPCVPVGNGAAILACEDVLNTTDEKNIATVNETPTEIIQSNKLEKCVLPPYPQNGWYTSYPPDPPGASANTYQLDVTCNPGYRLIGQNSVRCIFGQVEGEMPACVGYCKVEEQSTITCGEQEHRCTLSKADRTFLGIRRQDSDNECGLLSVPPRRRRLPISGGFTPGPNEFPWHTGIYKMFSEALYGQICGGTLITKSVVVSAAHCFTLTGKIASPALYGVAVGKRFRRWSSVDDTYAQKSKVKEIKIPARYQGAIANFQEDIALVITVEEFEYTSYVRPACVRFDPKFDEEQLEPGNLGKIAGWGLTDEDAEESKILQAAYLPSISINKCIQDSPVSFKGSITADKICGGYDNGTSACHGDSGGGFVVPSSRNGDKRYYLHGVISTSPVSDKACNIYTWITFTHILRHEHFIKSVALDL